MSTSESIIFQADRYAITRVSYEVGEHALQRDIIRHLGAVVILPVLEDGRILMIRNYRISLEKTLLEVPAGTMEAGEPAEVTAARELIEETGFHADKFVHLRTFYPSPGICDEAMHVFLATDLHEGTPEREPYEQIENQLVAAEQAKTWMKDGTIEDGKTLIALMHYFHCA